MEMKEVFSVKLQSENQWFSLRQNSNKTQAPQIRNIMQSSNTFIRISGPIPDVKNTALINDWENIIVYWEEFEESEALVNRFGLFQVQLEGLVGVATPENTIFST